jgi:prepilin-type N-terminal cleavage/methylation domain-containing protein
MQSKFNKAFTLVELIVAIAIIVTLSSIVVANFQNGNKSRAVQAASDTVASAVRTAQENSLSSKVISTINCSSSKVPADYSLKFNSSQPTTITLWAYDKCRNPAMYVQTFTFPASIELKSGNSLELVNSSGTSSFIQNFEIKFAPPFGNLTISSGGGAYQKFNRAIITVGTLDSQFTKKIIVDGISGKVDIQ